MTKPKLFTALLLLLMTGTVFSADSLCMRLADTLTIIPGGEPYYYCEDAVFHEGYIYMPMYTFLGVYHIDGAGELQCDTTLLYHDLLEVVVRDSILFVSSRGALIVCNVSEPSRPESLNALPLIEAPGVPINFVSMYPTDSILYANAAGYPLKINIENLDSLYKMDVYGVMYGGCIDFPYYYSLWPEEDPGHDPFRYWRSLFVSSFADGDTISNIEYVFESDQYLEEARCAAGMDSIIFLTGYGRSRYLEAYQVNSAKDSVWLLDTWNDITTGYEPFFMRILVKDSTVVLASETDQLYVISAGNPSALTTSAYYCDTTVGRYFQPFVVDSFIVVPTRYNTNRIGLRLFVYPCTGCDGNCELEQLPENLELETFPNPFNSRCEIRTAGTPIEKDDIKIFDISGRQITTELEHSSKHSFIWNASSEPSGVYLVVLEKDKQLLTKKVVYLS